MVKIKRIMIYKVFDCRMGRGTPSCTVTPELGGRCLRAQGGDGTWSNEVMHITKPAQVEGVKAKSTPTASEQERLRHSVAGEQPVGKMALDLGPEEW